MKHEGSPISGTLIAGPARAGKSTLAAALVGEGDGPAVLTVEALFPVFRKHKPPLSVEERARFIQNYLMRPRYMDSARSQTRCPADDMGNGLDAVVEAGARKEANASVSLIAATLDTWATSIGKSSWIAPDLHAEIYFSQFAKTIPNLHMIVLLRDPREAVAAALYWRTYPKRISCEWKRMIHRLLLWCLSADTGCRLARLMQDRVRVVFIDTLTDQADRLPRKLFPSLTIPPPPIGNPSLKHFSYSVGRGWLGPDGRWLPLLSEIELGIIERVSKPWFSAKDNGGTSNLAVTCLTHGTRAILAIVLCIARLSPGFAKSAMDFAFFPISCLKKIFLDLGLTILRKNRPS